jgi:hypothetical protein
MKRKCKFIYFDKIYSFYINICFFRSSKEKVNPPEMTSNPPKKTEISSSIDKQQDKTSSNPSRRENESSRERDRDRDRDRRDYHSSQTSSNRYRDREDYNHRYSGSRRRYSPPSSSRGHHYDRNRGKNFKLKNNLSILIIISFYLKCLYSKHAVFFVSLSLDKNLEIKIEIFNNEFL